MIPLLLLALLGCNPDEPEPVVFWLSVENASSSDFATYYLCYDDDIVYACLVGDSAFGAIQAGGTAYEMVILPGSYWPQEQLAIDVRAIDTAGNQYAWGPVPYTTQELHDVDARFTDANMLP